MGTSKKLSFSYNRCQDHPHACGDKLDLTYGISLIAGSSPRVWGQGNRNEVGGASHGIIPTRVGTRGCRAFCFGVYKDHPHACGDKYYNTDGIYTMWGSSPRVWGQVIADLRLTGGVGIIPTRVGTRRCIADYL